MMGHRRKCIPRMLALFIAFYSFSLMAIPSMQMALIQRYPKLKGTPLDSCTTCHYPAEKSFLNRFALDWKNSGSRFKEIELMDSDGDGINNIQEIKQRQFPGSLASTEYGGELFNFQATEGLVAFYHGRHIRNPKYLINWNCSKCHSRNGMEKKFNGPRGSFKKTHQLCLDCHINQSKKRAPLTCAQCHKK